MGASWRQSLRARSLRVEPLEDRRLLSMTVGIGTPVLAVFSDPTATAATTFSTHSTNPDVTATVLHTSEMLKMQVHTVNANGTTGVSGEMDFLLLDDYAPANIAHITALANSGFYNGLTFERIVQDFIQGGDPSGNGGSGPNHALVKQDDEFNADVRFTSSGLLALTNNGPYVNPGSRPDTNDCQFFVTSGAYRDGDFQYTIIGKLVTNDSLRQAIDSVPVVDNGSGEISKPVNAPIIDSVSVVSNPNNYGLVMLKAGTTATANETSSVTVTASTGSVTLTDSDGSSQSALSVVLATDTPSLNDRPAFVAKNMPNVTMDTNTSISVSVPVVEGDAGVGLAYGGTVQGYLGPSFTVTGSGSGATDGKVTITASNNIAGVYSLLVGVWRHDSNSNANTAMDSQAVALYVHPAAPASLSLLSPVIGQNGTTYVVTQPTFHVTGATSGMTVAVFADGGSTPIGTATVPVGATSVDIPTTAALADGSHTFTVEQSVAYGTTAVGNRTIAAGTLYSKPSASTVTATVDTAPPTATINQAATQADPSNASTINFTAVFDEQVVDFVAGDVTIGGTAGATTATVTPVGSDGKTYTVAITGMTHDGTVTVSVPAGKVHDEAGNVNIAATSTDNSVTYDNTPPTVTIDEAIGQADPTNSTTINFTAVFSEPVADFATGDVTITGTAGATTATVTPVGSDGTKYTVAVTGMTHDGTVIVSLAAGVAHDQAGNPNAASTSTDNSVTCDITPPAATIDQADGQTDPTNTAPIDFKVVFSEPVVGFTTGDVIIGGAAGATTATVTPVGSDGTTYNVAVTGMTRNGAVTISMAPGAAHDLLGNPSLAPTIIDNSVTYDGYPPSVTINQATGQPDPTNAATINFTVVFDEPVIGFTLSDVTISGPAGATPEVMTPVGSDGTTYNVAVTGMTQDGTVIASVPGGVVTDQMGRLNFASTSSDNSVTYDTTSPTVTINQAIGQADPTDVSTVNFTAVFSEPVVEFAHRALRSPAPPGPRPRS